MILTCPCCAGRFSIEAALTDEQARQAVAAALKLPAPLGDRVIRYLALFRPKQQALRWDKAARLLTELTEAVNAGQIEHEGRTYAAPRYIWEIALDKMLGKPPKGLPLKNNGYLWQVIVSVREELAARQEAQIEEARRVAPQGERRGPIDVAKQMENVKALKGALKS